MKTYIKNKIQNKINNALLQLTTETQQEKKPLNIETIEEMRQTKTLILNKISKDHYNKKFGKLINSKDFKTFFSNEKIETLKDIRHNILKHYSRPPMHLKNITSIFEGLKIFDLKELKKIYYNLIAERN